MALHTRPALCAEMVWVRSEASLRKFLAGTEFFRVIADVCLCPDLFRPGRVRPLAAPDLRHQRSVSGGRAGLYVLVPTHLVSLRDQLSGSLCCEFRLWAVPTAHFLYFPLGPPCPRMSTWGLGSGFCPDAVPVRPPSHHVVVHSPVSLLPPLRTWS